VELSTDDHIDWIADAIKATSRSGAQHREVSVPDCPGWTVGHVIDHEARSVGLGWASWLQHGPDIDGLARFAELPPMEPGLSGQSSNKPERIATTTGSMPSEVNRNLNVPHGRTRSEITMSSPHTTR
jgi:hypothetical protein